MPITIIDTIGGEDSNSYISLTDAEGYFALRSPAAPNWAAAASNDIKSKALITATRLLDQMVIWDGATATEEQALFWPRLYLYNSKGFELEGDELPDELRWAVCEYAEVLLNTDKTADYAAEGVEALKVGSISIQFSDSQPPQRTVLPEIVWDLVRRWGTRADIYPGSALLIRG